jgi:hypothetical protein
VVEARYYIASTLTKRAAAIVMRTTPTRFLFGRVALALALTTPLMLATSGSAHADTTGTTGATITIQGGSLGITVPTGTVNLGTLVNTVLGGDVAGPLGVVTVSDARSAAAGSGWVASVISTAFTPPSGPALAASLVSYSAGTVTKIGTATYTANDPASLTGVSAVVTATGITGDNSATWDPTITVHVPGATLAGVYSATITHSVV